MQYFYYREARDSTIVRKVTDGLKASFDPRIYPYLADEFVHPDEARAAAPKSNVVSLFPSRFYPTLRVHAGFKRTQN